MDTSKTCYLFFDYDGTVFTHGTFAPETVEAMNMAQQMGHMLILNTGRARGGLDLSDSQNAGIHWDGTIFGANDIQYHGHQFPTNPIHPKYIKKYFRFAVKNHLQIYFECEKKNLIYDFQSETPKKNPFQLQKLYHQAKKHIRDNSVTKFSFKGGNPNDMKLPKAPIYYLYFGRYFEMYPIGRDKGSVIKDFCRLTGADLNQCVSFGDSLNDLAMFKATPVSISMKQTPEDVAKFSTYQATSDFGVAEGIHWLFDKKSLDK